MTDKPVLDRRQLLVGAFAVTASQMVPDIAEAWPSQRIMPFFNIHTGEKMNVNLSQPSGQNRAINRFMRDFRQNKIIDIDDRAITKIGRILALLEAEGGHPGRVDIVSAYRTKKTNDYLRASRGGQASNSYHIKGKAIDFRLRGVSLSDLRDAALAVAKKDGYGGVGYYPSSKSNFVHIDTGPRRVW